MRFWTSAVAAACMAVGVSHGSARADREAGHRRYLFRPVRRRRRAAGPRHPALREAAREGPAARREAGDHPARRHRPQSRGRQAHGAGTDHARPRAASGRRGLHAERAGDRAAGDRGEGAVHRHERRHRDDHHQVALHRAHVVHHVAVELSAGRVGGEERHQEGLHRGDRTMAPASMPRRRSPRASPTPAARSSARCTCRWTTPTTCRSCSAPRMPDRMRCSSSFPAARMRRR